MAGVVNDLRRALHGLQLAHESLKRGNGIVKWQQPGLYGKWHAALLTLGFVEGLVAEMVEAVTEDEEV